MSAAAISTPRTARGFGDGTTLRQPRPASSTIVQPDVFWRTSARSLEKKGPIGFDGFRNAGSAASTSTCVMIVTTCFRNPARGSSLSNASSSRKPMEPSVCATQKSSDWGGTLSAASSAWMRMFPTCGPLPWTTISS